ncbi:MAG: DUF2179 domain-containing protein [Deltaproteobacteria bacterium]|nr:MAG: DUF2179 domain-containing protein [Deltaproteobacteria bacterium]
MQTLTDGELFRYLILPLLIFSARVVDVSLGTLRIIYLSRGFKLFAAICAFFEILIWLAAITQIFQHLSNFIMYIAYAAGFATGSYVGITIENKLAVGFVAVRIITQKDANELVGHLREMDYGVTTATASGISGSVRLVFTIIRRKDLNEIIDIIRQFNPKAFFSVEDVRAVKEGIFPPYGNRILNSIRSVRKAK